MIELPPAAAESERQITLTINLSHPHRTKNIHGTGEFTYFTISAETDPATIDGPRLYLTDAVSRQELPLPHNLASTIYRYLRLPDYIFYQTDCRDFANFCAPYDIRDSDFWQFHQFENIFQINPGDIVISGNLNPGKDRLKSVHAAVYLGNGLFFSKFGHGQTLCAVTYLNGLREAYQVNDVVVLRPKS